MKSLSIFVVVQVERSSQFYMEHLHPLEAMHWIVVRVLHEFGKQP